MADPIAADCHTDFMPAAHSSGHRPLSDIRYVVMHDTEGGTSRSIAQYFQSQSAGGSAHLTVDDNACYRSLGNDVIPWGAPGANQHGFHIEQCGYAKWSAVIWKSHLNTLKRAAYKAAFHCHKFGLPPVFIRAAELQQGAEGITTHAECTKAFGGSHTDPGALWPRTLFMAFVKKYYDELSNV